MLAKGQYIHFYPEGNLRPYATNLLPFKRGAFYLAARARVPLVPMAISYHKPTGLRKVFRNKPDLILHIGKPIYPISSNEQEDIKIRLNRAEEQINEMLCNTESVS